MFQVVPMCDVQGCVKETYISHKAALRTWKLFGVSCFSLSNRRLDLCCLFFSFSRALYDSKIFYIWNVMAEHTHFFLFLTVFWQQAYINIYFFFLIHFCVIVSHPVLCLQYLLV